jgi:hypothetical protein
MEVDYTDGIAEKDLKVYRSFMNTKIDIYQPNDGYVFRKNKTTEAFHQSFEHRQMQNSAAKILSSASSMLVYSLAKSSESLNSTKKKMKSVFTMTKVEDPNYNAEYVENKYNQFNKKVMLKKLENDTEYLQLCEYINNPRFNDLMRTNLSFVKYILNHKYIKYHPQFEEISEKYRKFLCPMYSQADMPADNMDEDEPEDEAEN